MVYDTGEVLPKIERTFATDAIIYFVQNSYAGQASWPERPWKV
jgi:hypothetical protein